MEKERPEFSHPMFNDPEECRKALNSPPVDSKPKVPVWLREAQEEADNRLKQAKLDAEKTTAEELRKIREDLSQ